MSSRTNKSKNPPCATAYAEGGTRLEGSEAKILKALNGPKYFNSDRSGDISFSELQLFDLNGNLLWQKRNNGAQNVLEVELPDLPAGIYVLRIGDSIKKMIIR